jgi:hypothetical protein
VVAPGDDHDGQIGRIYELLGADDYFTVCIKFSGDPGVYAFEPDELEAVPSPHSGDTDKDLLTAQEIAHGDRAIVVVMADRTFLPASGVDHRGIHHWRLGVGAAI